MDNLFSPYADRLLGCWCAQLETRPLAEWDPAKARCSFRFDQDEPTMGLALLEDECRCGTAWVRVADWYITSQNAFPGPDNTLDAQRCPTAWALVLELGIGRCPPIGDEKKLPTVAELNAFHQLMMEDAASMRKAIYCCFGAVDPMDVFVLGQPRRTGPNGACMQQSLPITVMVVNCDECQPES